ncbi:MAG: hypothetical protein AAF497_20740, partial [Planctomycetota bacterium]
MATGKSWTIACPLAITRNSGVTTIMGNHWFEYSGNPSGITAFFDDPPSLQNIVIREFDGSTYFDHSSCRLWFDFPDGIPAIPDGSIFSVCLQFNELTELLIRTPPTRDFTSTLAVHKTEDGLIRLMSEGETTINVICHSFLIESVVSSTSSEAQQQLRA